MKTFGSSFRKRIVSFTEHAKELSSFETFQLSQQILANRHLPTYLPMLLWFS